MQHKQLKAEFDVSQGDRSFIATITSQSVDRDREVLLPDGMNSKDFESNPVVLWNHNADRPIGKAVGLRRDGARWTAKAVLAERPDSHVGEWFPDTVHSLMKQGVVKGVSVGLIPEPGMRRRPTPHDKEMFGDQVESVVSKWKLLEFSVTPLPANQDALIHAVSKGIVTEKQVKSIFDIDLKGKKPKPRKKAVIFLIDNPQKTVSKRAAFDLESVITRSVAKSIGRIYIND